ncbi:MAG: hypothetical protein VW982_02870 [Candidatus Poseidoniales archaeon]|jgi:hypothetical protein
MGVRDWFKSKSTDADEPDPSASQEEQEEVEHEAFSRLQATKTAEALSLFEEEDEPSPPRAASVAAPYDAGDAELTDLSAQDQESFTHVDEVEIVDVASLDDPYLQASIEGDVPESVVFDDDENPASV